MAEVKKLARVILRSDGSVHIAFRDIRSIYATAENLRELFSHPVDFIESGSHAYMESTFEINRKRVSLEDILGLTLACVNSDKQIICDFPELFQYIFSSNKTEPAKNEQLNMRAFEWETVLSDEKSFLLHYYLEFTNNIRAGLEIKRNINLREEVQFQIVREILNAFFEEELPKAACSVELSNQISLAEGDHVLKANGSAQDSDMVSVSEYAKLLNIVPATVRCYISQGRIKSAVRMNNGQYLIDKNEIPLKWDLRRGRKIKKPGEGKMYRRPPTGSAADVKECILKNGHFTNWVASYIHSYDELDYYKNRSYHEVHWDGRACLIIDVNPDYVSSKTGISNRELMLAGKAPVVPDRNKEEFVYHVHHVGQNTSSPFAIIPEYDHNGKGYSAIFHHGAPNADLHGPEFEALKINFWRTYVEAYDKAGRFSAIPYENSKHKKGK